jgi:hypothetical protein
LQAADGPQTAFSQTLMQNPVAVLVAIGLTISGEIWRAWTLRDSHMWLKRQVLTVLGSYWRKRREGLKGRCSTTELRPWLFITSYIEES